MAKMPVLIQDKGRQVRNQKRRKHHAAEVAIPILCRGHKINVYFADIAEDIEDEWQEVKLDVDQNRKVARLLESGDDIQDCYNGAMISGLDLTGTNNYCRLKNFY